jgi:hypothetical protein
MSAAEVLAAVIRARYDETGSASRYPTEESLAEYLLEHLPEHGIAVVELPKPADPGDFGDGYDEAVGIWNHGDDSEVAAWNDGTITDCTGEVLINREEARAFGLALLAAADALDAAEVDA